MNSFAGLKGTFSTILMDPPWRFENRTGKMAPEHKRLKRYDTMSMAEIAALPVATLPTTPVISISGAQTPFSLTG